MPTLTRVLSDALLDEAAALGYTDRVNAHRATISRLRAAERRLESLEADFPVPTHLRGLALVLCGREYPDAAIRAVLGFAARFGTVEACRWFDDIDRAEDRAAAEAALPNDPAWGRGDWDAEFWAEGGGA